MYALIAQTTPAPRKVDIHTPSFWTAVILLAVLACLLIYGIFETNIRTAIAGGGAAVELLRRNSKRLWILIAGTAVIVFGIIIAPLPGPGPVILVPIGLGILATEFAWARKLQLEVRRRASPFENATKQVASRTPRWVVIPALLLYWCIPAALTSFTSLHTGAIWSVAGAFFAPFLLWAWMVFKGQRVVRAESAASATNESPKR